jgi:hypothetical protein
VTSDVVLDWTSTTYTPGNFFLAANLTVAATVQVPATLNVWNDIFVNAKISSACNNLILFVWEEGAVAQWGWTRYCEPALYDGAPTSEWLPVPVEQDLARCQRYYQKSFDVDQNPVQNSGVYLGALEYYAAAAGVSNNGVKVHLPVRMRGAPVVTAFNPGAANALWRNVSDGADSGAATVRDAGQEGFVLENAQAAGDGVGERLAIQWSAEAEL